ncbi:MAG: RNA degradosome polyphosphate kinase [Clostridia bacterium]|nr:RNA degradosome polyphosphate kinase [Clostridia bacterium]
METKDFSQPEFYLNRELSWLEFNQRVLDEADDSTNPLFERLKFLGIVNSNLDEFFMVRVGSLHDQINAGYNKADSSGLTPEAQLSLISQRVQRMVGELYDLWNDRLVPALKKNGVRLLMPDELNKSQKAYLSQYFDDIIYPVLTPMAVDSSRPFPWLQNKAINIGVLVENSEEGEDDIFATIQVPAVFSRLVELSDKEDDKKVFILLEHVITLFIDRLFTGKTIKAACVYRITRNGDLAIDEDEAEDLLLEIEKTIKQRRWGQAVRLEISRDTHKDLLDILQDRLEIEDAFVFKAGGPLDLTCLLKLYGIQGFERKKYPVYEPQKPSDLVGKGDIFEAIREKDILLHHPYESFDPIVNMIKEAARDPRVLAIKQTLYRVSGKSPIVKALAEAADLGKQVTVLVELKARFDEENNIQWAKSLEKAGCHVIYGLVGLKTHCKITLIVRMEDDGINRYVHLSTGNYNDVTAKIYTDLGLLTCNKYIGEDASTVFNALSGYTERPRLSKLVMAPTMLRHKFVCLIEREIKNASMGKNAGIRAKLNSLVDPGIIELLYKASQAGVKIELLVRGMCSLRPNLPGVSENIQVKSIVGRYLEHSRIYCFENGGDEEIYLSSADWMERNLDRRVELLIPVEDEDAKDRIKDVLDTYMRDNVKTRVLGSDGLYQLVGCRGVARRLSAQDFFMNEALLKAKDETLRSEDIIFKPRMNPQQG